MADSEYSFATGNTEEFVLGKIGLLEEIEALLIDDPSLEFFLPFIIEDLVLAYSLGIKGDMLVVPLRLYKRRVLTTPILRDNLVGDNKSELKLAKNCFNKLSAETAETTKQVIEEYSENPVTRRTLEMFRDKLKGTGSGAQRKHSHDEGHEEEEGMIEEGYQDDVVYISKKEAKLDSKQGDLNLKAYEDMTALIDKESKQFKTLIQKFNVFFTKYRSSFQAAPVQIGDLVVGKSFSYTAQEKILEMKLHGKHIKLLNRLNDHGNQVTKLLIQLNNTIQKASSYLHGIKNLPEAHQVKVHDIMDIVVRAVDLEEEVLETYIKKGTATEHLPKKDLAELQERSQALWDIAIELETNKKYQMRKEAVEYELKQAEADLASRMDKIRSRIYMSYNKSKMIAKQIYMLRSRAGAR